MKMANSVWSQLPTPSSICREVIGWSETEIPDVVLLRCPSHAIAIFVVIFLTKLQNLARTERILGSKVDKHTHIE